MCDCDTTALLTLLSRDISNQNCDLCSSLGPAASVHPGRVTRRPADEWQGLDVTLTGASGPY